jgi:hypothetical protein
VIRKRLIFGSIESSRPNWIWILSSGASSTWTFRDTMRGRISSNSLYKNKSAPDRHAFDYDHHHNRVHQARKIYSVGPLRSKSMSARLCHFSSEVERPTHLPLVKVLPRMFKSNINGWICSNRNQSVSRRKTELNPDLQSYGPFPLIQSGMGETLILPPGNGYPCSRLSPTRYSSGVALYCRSSSRIPASSTFPWSLNSIYFQISKGPQGGHRDNTDLPSTGSSKMYRLC